MPSNSRSRDQLKESNPVLWVNDQFANERESKLTLKYFSVPEYIRWRDAYFGFKVSVESRNWLNAYWFFVPSLETETQLIGSQANEYQYSYSVTPTKTGLFIERRHSINPGVLFISRGGQSLLANDSLNMSTVSPDGCYVVFGAGDYRPRKNYSDFVQKTKVFDACAYYKNKIEEVQK